MSRNIAITPGEFYHLYNRGTEKRKIFLNTADYERFLSLLFLCNGTHPVRIDNLLQQQAFQQGRTLLELAFALERGKPLVDICAYVLMPNHFHLLVRECEEGGISHFMQKLLTAYTMYFNTRRTRSGALFQGKYKATHAHKDRYLKYLTSYIHLNPIKLIEPKWKETGIVNRSKAEKFLTTYRYSSFLDYSGDKRIEGCLIEKTALPEYFETPKSFRNSVTEWLNFRE